MWSIFKIKSKINPQQYWTTSAALGAIGWGIPLGIALMIGLWQYSTIPRYYYIFLILLASIGTGFCSGVVMFFYFLTSTKIKKRRHAFLHGFVFWGIPYAIASLHFQHLYDINLNHTKIIFILIFFMIMGSFLRLGLYELELRKKRKAQEGNNEKTQA